MAYLKIGAVKRRAQDYMKNRPYVSARSIATESERLYKQGTTYDVFLSHCTKDLEIVIGVKAILEDGGKTVYVDWIEDPELDRSNVTQENARLLRSRMKSCSSMIFIATDNASTSKWMPWELGFFDGHKADSVAILPVIEDWKNSFEGQEYLSLYPVIEDLNGGKNPLAIRRKNSFQNILLNEFITGRSGFYL